MCKYVCVRMCVRRVRMSIDAASWVQTCEVLDLLRHVADEPMTIGARHHLLAIRKVLLRRCGPLTQNHFIDCNLCNGGQQVSK